MKTREKKKASLKAMDYLARRDHSEKELRTKLKTHYTPEEVDEAIDYIKQHGWLIDPTELSYKVAESLHRKRKSHLYILQFLQKKGLPSVEMDEEREREKALDLLKSKAKGDFEFNKLHSLLKNRGFDTDTIRKVIHEIRKPTPSI